MPKETHEELKARAARYADETCPNWKHVSIVVAPGSNDEPPEVLIVRNVNRPGPDASPRA